MPTALDTPNTYPTYTNRNLDEGVFEQLMAAVKHHVKEEYEAGRIQADTYGQVYLGLTESVLQNSTAFILGMLLIDEKRRGQDLSNQQAEYQLEILLPLQAQQIQKEIEKLTEEIRQMAYTTDFVLPKQVEKMDAEISLMGKQEDKLDKEIEFLSAKIMTERANTEAGIADTGSLIGKQITLLTAQKLGFSGDIQVKVGKLYADYNGIFQSVQEVETETELHTNTQTILSVAEGIASTIKTLP